MPDTKTDLISIQPCIINRRTVEHGCLCVNEPSCSAQDLLIQAAVIISSGSGWLVPGQQVRTTQSESILPHIIIHSSGSHNTVLITWLISQSLGMDFICCCEETATVSRHFSYLYCTVNKMP